MLERGTLDGSGLFGFLFGLDDSESPKASSVFARSCSNLDRAAHATIHGKPSPQPAARRLFAGAIADSVVVALPRGPILGCLHVPSRGWQWP